MKLDKAVSIVDQNRCVSLLQSADPITRLYAVYWFDKHPQVDLPEMIGDMLHDPDQSIICRVLDCIGNRKAIEFADDVLAIFENSSGSISGHAAFTLGKLQFANAVTSLSQRMYTLSDFDQFLGVCYALGEIGGDTAELALLDALDTYDDEFFFEFLMISLIRMAGPKHLPHIIRRYLKCLESYIEGRETIRWFWRAIDCEHLYSAKSEGVISQNYQWLTGHPDFMPPLFNLQLPDSLDFNNPEPWIKDSLKIMRKTIDEDNPQDNDMARGFIDGFYQNADLLKGRSPSLLLKEIDFLVACYCSIKTHRNKKSDDALIEQYPQDNESIQDFLDESFYLSKKGGYEILERFRDHLSESNPGNSKQVTTYALVLLAKQSGGEVLRKFVMKLYSGLNSKNAYESKACSEALTFCPDQIIELLRNKWEKQGVLIDPEIHLLGILPCKSAATLLLEVLKNGNKNEMQSAVEALTDIGCKEAIDALSGHPAYLSGTMPDGNLNLLKKIWSSRSSKAPILTKSKEKLKQDASIIHILGKKSSALPAKSLPDLKGTILPFKPPNQFCGK